VTDIRHLFAPVAPAVAGQPFSSEHALILQAYHRFHAPFLTAGFVPTSATVNEAVEWWNRTVLGGGEA
jgi:hypothetical protein